MARSWSEVSTKGNDDSSSACHGVSGSEGVPGHLQSSPVEGHQLLGHLVHGGPGLGAGPLPFGASQPGHRRGVATGIGRQQFDLVGGQVQLVGPPVLEEQIVAGCAPHGAGDHAAVPGHSVLAVDDVVSGGEVVEEPVDGAGPGAGLTVRAATAGDVGLGENGDPRLGQDESAIQPGHHDSSTWVADQIGSPGHGPDRASTDSLLGQNPRQPVGARPGGGAQHHRVIVVDQSGDLRGQPGRVSHDGLPPPALDRGDVGSVGRGDQRDNAALAVGQ